MPSPGTMQGPLLPVFAQQVLGRGMAQTGAGGSGKGEEGRVQGWFRNGDRKGPAGGGVDASDASPADPVPGSAAATASPTPVPSVVQGVSRTPTMCWALCWDLAGEEVLVFVELMF